MKDDSKTKKQDFSEEKYKNLIENINAGIYSNTPGPKGKFIEANPAIVKMFGYKNKKDFLKTNVSNLYQNPEDRKRFNQKIQKDKYVKNEDLKLKRKNRSTFWGSVSAVAVTDKKGEIKHYDGTIVDINDRKKMEQALKEKEAFNFALFQYAPQNNVVVDREGKIIKTNMKKRISDSRLPNLGDVMYRDYASKHKTDMYGELMKCIKSGKTKKFPEQKYGKKILAIIIAPFPEGAIITSQDITEQKLAEEALREKQQLLSNVFESMQGGVLVLGSDFRYTYWNKAMEEISHNPREEVLGNIPWEKYPFLKGHIQHAMKKAMKGEISHNVELAYSLPDGTKGWTSESYFPLKDEQGGIAGVVGIINDITERKLAEEKIEKSLKEKTILLQEIHHRVKNNLQIIASLLNLQSRRIKDKEALEMFQATRKRVFSMALVHERLYKSKDFARVDFRKYIKEMTVHLLSFHRDKMEKVRFEKDIKKTIIDINKAVPLGLILNELITNALKHAFPKNREGKIKIKFNKKGSRYDLMISDDGIGFPKDLDFRKAESMGLTLITSLVNQIDGEIELDRSKGTSFKIIFKE
jgi:PAS domain S-box-containing protein